jgi:membrane-associated phospholipid phosphatase
MLWSKLFHLGDLSLTLPTGMAIAAWLLAARARRAAAGWLLVFGLALALVAATKVAFMGWATGLPAFGYKAVSGHAAGFTAAFPTLCWLLTRRCARRLRTSAAVLALGLGLAVAVALVRAGEHTPAEASAGWIIGLVAFLCTIVLAGNVPAPPPGRAFASAALAFGATAWALHSVSVGYWMIKLALALSGNPHPYPWDNCS